MFSKLTQQDFFCDLERRSERTKEDTTLEAVDTATFFKLKACTEALHLITCRHAGEKSMKNIVWLFK